MGYELGILFGILSMLGFGLSNAISQKLVRKIGELSSIVFQAFVTLFILFPLFFIYPINFSFSIYYIGIALVIALMGVIPLFTFYKALKLGKVGIVVPIANSSPITTVVLSVIFLNEVLSVTQTFSIIMIVLGVILVSLKLSGLKKNNIAAGVPYALVTSVMWGVYFFLSKFPVDVLGPTFTAAITQLGIFFFTAAYAAKENKLALKISSDAVKYAVITGVALAAGVAAYDIGITLANVSIVASLASASPLVAALYARIFYKEKLEKLQYLALLMIAGGVILLSI